MVLCDGGVVGNCFGDNLVWFDLEVGGFDFLKLVFGGLFCCGDVDIGKGVWYEGNFV